MNSDSSLRQSHAYFDAWNRRDARAVLDTLAPDGTYEDPTTKGPISGDTFAGTMETLWNAFPDLAFDLGGVHVIGDDAVHAFWTMRGHNTGPFLGLPPTGRPVSLDGFDVIHCSSTGLRHVRGYFDSVALPRQLGLDVIVQPREIGPFRFGTSIAARRDTVTSPGVLAFTELFARDDNDVQTVRNLSRQTVVENIDNPDFLGFTGTVVGRRMTTVTSWTSHEALSTSMASGTHRDAMQAFFRKDGPSLGGITAVFAPVRYGPAWRRCDCGSMQRLTAQREQCSLCGAAIEQFAG